MTRWRANLDNWRLWVGISYFGLVFVIVGLMFVNQRTTKTLAKQTAAAVASYNRCIASIPILEEVSNHVSGVNMLAEILVRNNAAALAATEPGDPLYEARRASTLRLRSAQKEIASIATFPVPTAQQCRQENR